MNGQTASADPRRIALIWLTYAGMALIAMADSHPNVLFIAVDDLRPSVGCYGDPHAVTPNIDRLASRGMRFDNAYCQVAVCNPSRASLMTGLRPDHLGVWTLPIHFREAKPDAVTLPQWLRRFGYTAVSHGKIFHNPTPDPQSWSEPIRTVGETESGYPEGWKQQVQAAQAKLPAGDWRKNNLRGLATAAPDIDDHLLIDGARTDMAIEDLRRLGASKQPFFLAMGYIRPHLPWVAPKKYWDLYDADALPVITDGQVTSNTPSYALSTSYELTHYVDQIDFPEPWDPQRVTDARARQLMHGYYASIAFTDAQIGRLLDALEEEGLVHNTVVVLWSDHGWKLGEFNGWGKMTNYEIDTRVPMIICTPDMKAAGQSTSGLAELVDLFPTLCELTGIEIPDFVDGTSLASLLDDPGATVDEAAFSQYYRRHDDRQYMGYAIRTPTHRFIEWRNFETGEVTARELYDHRSDHSESVNVIGSAPEQLIDSLTARLLESHPRRGRSLTPGVHSNPNRDRFPVPLSFFNSTDSELLIYPITPKGTRGRVLTCKPQATTTTQARIGGVFVVESRDGSIHQIHSPSYPQKTVEVRPR